MLAAREAKLLAIMKDWVCMILVCSAAVLGSAGTARAAAGGEADPGLVSDLLQQLTDPLFWFGLAAQGLFFARFFIQWLVSRRSRRVGPAAFWYFSLAGAICWFVMACCGGIGHHAGPLSCFFCFRNLILIRAQTCSGPSRPPKWTGESRRKNL